MLETRFRRPDNDLTEEVVVEALRGAGVDASCMRPAAWEVVETGSNSLVVLTGPVAVRVARDASGAADLLRAQLLVDKLPDLPFAVPRSLGPAVDLGGLLAVPTTRLDGEPHPAGFGDPSVLRELLDAIHGIDAAPLRDHLAPPRSFCGGDRWEEVLREEVLPRLPADVQDEALERVDELAALRPPCLVVNHGDLAGSNMLWREGRVVGVLDWDLTAEEDPAEDLASLAGWHGWELADRIADAETVRRALVFRRSGPLQLVAFAVTRGRDEAEVARAVERATRRLRES